MAGAVVVVVIICCFEFLERFRKLQEEGLDSYVIKIT